MELLDIYDKNRKKTGRIVPRGKENLKEGEYFLAVEALLIDKNGHILISKRTEKKKLYPVYWEINGGGCKSGEESIDAIIREIKEELGITLSKEKSFLIKTVKNEYRFKDIWFFEIDNIDRIKINLQKEEVTEYKAIDFSEFEKMKKDNTLIDTSNITKEEYDKCIRIIKKNKA